MNTVLCVTALVIVVLNHAGPLSAETVDSGHFTNEWVAEIKGGLDTARSVAKRYGYEVVEEIPSFEDHYLLIHPDVPNRSKRSSHHHTKRLTEDASVPWAEQQFAKSRVKRAIFRTRSDGTADFNDPGFRDEWYLFDGGEARTRAIHHSLGVTKAWARGLTGEGVVVSVLDDGLEKNHTDIAENYDPYASTDLNDKDDDPHPRYDPTDENKHGTRCAGEIAMVANNNMCGVGVAFNSKIGGVRMLDGTVTDRVEAMALTFNLSHIDIFSASWGPNDDGLTVEGPGTLTRKALEKGIKEGRGGKGVIYAWASGNGGRMQDNCNCDGYTSSIYTLSVSSVTEHGRLPWYGELCPSTIASTYSSGNGGDHQVFSADLHNRCTSRHTGTSAAAPLAAGIFALVLEANPQLTWRDMQHLVMLTTVVEPLKGERGWYKNKAGFCVHPAFGSGLMNADAMTEVAKNWVTVPEQHKCVITPSSKSNLPVQLTSGHYVEVIVETNGCKGQDNEINFLEHVEFVFSLEYSKRGVIRVVAESPSGTNTTLMFTRDWDKSTAGFKNWPLMSVHWWGEDPEGQWKFRVFDDNVTGSEHGKLTNLTAVLYGTQTAPAYLKNGPLNKCDIGEVQESQMPEGKSENNIDELLVSLLGPNYSQPRTMEDFLNL